MGTTQHSSTGAIDGASRAGDGLITAVAAAASAPDFWRMPVLVAVSGGADSVALLLALRRIVPRDAVSRLIVVHAEHDLRDGAAADREFVAGLAARLGLPLAWRRLVVRDAGGVRGEGIEARARRLRYEFFAAAALEAGARHVAVAHTSDDQAETILHRLLRGTGLVGLGGMPAARQLHPGVALVRPLLGVSRGDARAFLAACRQEWREDPSNADTRHARNFLRHEVIGPCADGPYPAATAALVRIGHQASLVAGAIRSAAEHLLEAHSTRLGDGTVVVRTAELSGLDRHLVAEVFVTLWRRERWPQRDMTARRYTALADLAIAGLHSPRRNAPTADFPGGVRLRVGPDGRLEFRRTERPVCGPVRRGPHES
jgi:tRNA(Ile)-lysidine synthase